MNRKLLRVLELGVAAVLLVSLVMVLRTQMEYAQSASSYEEAADMARLPKFVPAPAAKQQKDHKEEDEAAASDPNLILMAEMDLDELTRINPDVQGWITIPDTVLSYPLLQGKDNNFYLKHSWTKSSSINGAVFMDYRSHADMTDFNTIIYGHRMRDGSMFDSLRAYEAQAHWETHPSVYLLCAGGVYRYDIFAAYEAKADITGPVYSLSYQSEEDKQAFIDSCLEQSLIESGIVPALSDRILTLSTCPDRGYATRWVVQAVLAEFYARDGGASGLDTAQ